MNNFLEEGEKAIFFCLKLNITSMASLIGGEFMMKSISIFT